MYQVYSTKRYDKEVGKYFSAVEMKLLDNIHRKIAEQPMDGDALGYTFFRERRLGGKRIYFVIYSELNAVLMVAVSDKKTQQETIDEIKSRLKDYNVVVQEAIKNATRSDGSFQP